MGHDSVIGNEAILANGTAVAGHVAIGDRAFLSANCLVHQFCRVGTLAMMQGGSAVSQDLPPFSIVKNVNELCGLNIVGMRRAGLTSEERLEIKRLYHALFRSKMNLRTAVDNARQETWGERAKILLEFVASTKRGICIDHGGGSGSEEG